MRVAPDRGPIGPNTELGPASAPANGPVTVPATQNFVQANHLHANPYPLVGAKGQGGVCMAGNENYAATVGQTLIGNPPGQSPKTTARVPRELNGD